MSPLPLYPTLQALHKNPLHKNHQNEENEPERAARDRLGELLADLGPQLRRGPNLAAENRGPASHSPSGIIEIDHLLGGGFPHGRLSEISGPPSSGRTSLALALLAATTRRGEFAAVVDRADGFDPPSAERAGVDLERVLWARAPTQQEALRCTERLLKTDGFPLLLLDLRAGRDRPPSERKPTTTATWVRLTRLAAGTRTAVVLLSAERLTGAHAEIALEMQPARARFTGTPALLEVLELRAALVRHRAARIDREASLRLTCVEGTLQNACKSCR